MTRRLPRSGTRLAALLLAAAVHASTASAQTSVQIPLQFDFVNPGAKSLALGGAFAGLADDATASFANPAGLRELGRPELSVEIRGRWLETLFLQRGRLSGTPTNELRDDIAGPIFGASPDNTVRVPYLSVVFPQPRRGWVIAAFRHELASVDQSYFSEGVFQKDPAELTSRRDSPQRGRRAISITSYGAAAALEINPRLAVGGTLNVYTFDLVSDFRRFGTEGFLGPPLLTEEFGRSTQRGEDIAFAPTVGLRMCLKPCDERQTTSSRFGVVYRRGPTFDFETQSGPNFRRSHFRVPDVFAAGAAIEVPRSGRRLVLTGEVRWIPYSQLVEDFIVDQTIDFDLQDRVTIEDGTEFHAGVQYTIETLAWLPRLRAGVWSDPDHSTKWVPGPLANHPELRTRDERLAAALSTGRRRTHYTGGLGLTFSPAVEWNFGADIASNSTIISSSVIVRFSR